jgi:16S rRNA (cytosine967-C5)-methyltransferase
VTVHHADGRKPGLEPGFDRVLVDAPCSGLGALRRRPEARWRKKESDIAELNELQTQLLKSALNLVRRGGVVVYSTCSPDLRETRQIVDAALAADASVEELDAHSLVPNMDNTGDEKSVQMWPHRHGTDAMFFAVLRKK